MVLALYTEPEGTYVSYRATRNHASEDVYLHVHHSNDFRSHKCSVAIILHRDSPINQTL